MDPLNQACTTCGPRKLLIRPAKPQILFILILSLKNIVAISIIGEQATSKNLHFAAVTTTTSRTIFDGRKKFGKFDGKSVELLQRCNQSVLRGSHHQTGCSSCQSRHYGNRDDVYYRYLDCSEPNLIKPLDAYLGA